LYGFAWLDLTREPQVVIVPDTAGRYYSIQLLDAYANSFAYVGRRTTGTSAGAYALTAPGWKGKLPAGVRQIAAPTAQVLAFTRTLVEGPPDLAAALAVQAKYALAPLSGYPSRAVPATAEDEPLQFPILDLSAQGAAFFDNLCQGLVVSPPPATDCARLARFATVLVADPVRPGLAPRGEPHPAVRDRRPHHGPRVRGRRLARTADPARRAGGRPGELAAGADRPVPPGPAHLSAPPGTTRRQLPHAAARGPP
jgi:hypothetical protein